MKKLFLQSVVCFCLISRIQASSEVVELEQGDEKYLAALRELSAEVIGGPFQIDAVAPTGELRGFTFPGFDEILYKFFEKREFISGKPCHVLDYACGSGYWAAAAVLKTEMGKFSLNIKAIDPFMQSEHSEHYNTAWSNYVRDNGSKHGSLSVGQGWLKDQDAANGEKYNSILVRDAIHLFSDEQIAELFQLGSALTDENGSIVVHATPLFATMLWHPRVQIFFIQKGLTPPNFGEILFNELSYKAYTDAAAEYFPGVFGQISAKSVCLPTIRNIAETNGWWLQVIQVGTTVMTHTKPLTEVHMYEFISTEVQKNKPKPEEFTINYKPKDSSIILRFKKNSTNKFSKTQ